VTLSCLMIDFLKHLISALIGLFASSSRREAEILILRQQLVVLRRKAPGRARVSPLDRFVLVWLYRFWPSLLNSILIVKPETIVRWHRNGFRFYWRWRSRNRGGRPKVDAEIRKLIRKVSLENPLWGAPRIHGELLKLGIDVCQSTVAKYMVKRPGPDGQTWKTFLRNHKEGIACLDFLVVPTVGFKVLYCLVILDHSRRKILWTGVTFRPSSEWVARQVTEAFAWEEAPRYLIRDNDRAFGLVYRRRLEAMGIRDRPTAPRSPWQNAYVERVIGSIRRECLDHMIVFSEAHLRRIMRSYVHYYNSARTHLSLEKDSPAGRSVQRKGAIKSVEWLGGLHHEYVRI
jgi:transposase InsO family protein